VSWYTWGKRPPDEEEDPEVEPDEAEGELVPPEEEKDVEPVAEEEDAEEDAEGLEEEEDRWREERLCRRTSVVPREETVRWPPRGRSSSASVR
jgi:hypothetical protein